MLPSQVLLFLALLEQVCIMCYVNVGLDQQLALPKVGAPPPLSSVPKAVRAISSAEWMGWPGTRVW